MIMDSLNRLNNPTTTTILLLSRQSLLILQIADAINHASWMPVLSELLYRNQSKGFCTGFSALDREISGSLYGLQAPSLTEISGPPGSGKTALMLALLLDALKAGCKCLWINAGYRAIPLERLRQMPGFKPHFENYIDFVNVFDLSEASLLPTFAQDRYALILMPSYHDVFPPLSPSIQKKRAYSQRNNQSVAFETRKAARTAISSILSQLSEHSCILITSNLVSLPDPTNGRLRILQPPLKLNGHRCVVLYRNHNGDVLTANGALLDLSSGSLNVKPERERPVTVEQLPSSCNDPHVLSSPMAQQSTFINSTTQAAASPLQHRRQDPEASISLLSDPPVAQEIGTPDDGSRHLDGIVLNSQLEYSDFPIEPSSKLDHSSPATGGWPA